MNDCTKNRVKFVAAVTKWLITSPDEAPPELCEAGICRSCALDLYGRFIELGSYYMRDAQAIVEGAFDGLQEQKQLPKPSAEFKH